MAVNTQGQRLFDGIAIGASILCMIHCLVLPVLIVLLPTLAAFFMMPEDFHVWALALAVPTSVLALATGYRRHRRIRPTIIALPGLGLLCFAGADREHGNHVVCCWRTAPCHRTCPQLAVNA